MFTVEILLNGKWCNIKVVSSMADAIILIGIDTGRVVSNSTILWYNY